jgi:phosphoglucomutase
MDAAIEAAVRAWLEDPAIAEADKKEICELRAAGNEKELTDRFYQDLEFGTGGMRGIIGGGRNRMNIYTIGAAAQGLANYVARQGEAAKKAGVALAYDSRRCSDLFATRVAEVMAGNGIVAYVFESLRPTPELSFAVRQLGCTAGGVVTASHNPAQWNGFKVYWSDGVQVVPPHDEAIMDEVQRVGGFGNVKTMDVAEARGKGLIKPIGREIDEAFLKEVDRSCLSPEVSREQGSKLKIVYTPLHGTGATLIPEALKRRGFEHVLVVPEQAQVPRAAARGDARGDRNHPSLRRIFRQRIQVRRGRRFERGQITLLPRGDIAHAIEHQQHQLGVGLKRQFRIQCIEIHK